MKPFTIEPAMLTPHGVFHPTGYLFLMFPAERDACNAERRLRGAGYNGEATSVLTPTDIQGHVARTVDNAHMSLPSPGTEAETVRRLAQLASQGHHALMIHAPSTEESAYVMSVLHDAPISYGQKYRHQVIETLVE